MSIRTPAETLRPSGPERDALASLRIERPDARVASGSGLKWKWIFGLLLLAVGGFLGFRYSAAHGLLPAKLVGSGATWVPEMIQNRIEVRLASLTVQRGRAADAVVVATGYLESRRQAKIGARAVGRINIIAFEEGNRVKEGDVLAELDHKDLDASLAATRASVARAKAALEEQAINIEQAGVDNQRSETLWKSRSISEAEFDVARFAYRTAVARKSSLQAELALAEAQVRQAEQLCENMTIRAPFDGTIISKDAEVGESIMPGGMGGGSGRGSVATLADLDHLEIEVDVQEDYISRVVEGQEADIAIDAVQSKKYHGSVRKIIPMGDRARATIKVQVQITDADALLFPEMAGTVYFLPSETQLVVSDEARMFCPTTAVDTNAAGESYVWIVDGQKRAQRIAVKTNEDRDGQTELVAGLTGNERVVVNPSGLQPGTPLTVVE